MPWLNYHSHSLFCDGKAAPEDFVRAALKKGFQAWGFSAHAPVSFPSAWNMPVEKFDSYLSEISRLRSQYGDQIELYAGLETDYLEEGWAYPAWELLGNGLDFLIGSVHYIGQFEDGTRFCFDVKPEGFFDGVSLLYGNDFRKAIKTYFHTVRQMIDIGKPDVVGHMDKIKMHNAVRKYFSEEDKWYRDEVEETLALIAETGCILEVNTRGLYKHDPPLLYPGRWVLERAFDWKIPVMLNSDAHHPQETDAGFEFTAGLLHEIGYDSLRVLLGGKWQDRSFTVKGPDRS